MDGVGGHTDIPRTGIPIMIEVGGLSLLPVQHTHTISTYSKNQESATKTNPCALLECPSKSNLGYGTDDESRFTIIRGVSLAAKLDDLRFCLLMN